MSYDILTSWRDLQTWGETTPPKAIWFLKTINNLGAHISFESQLSPLSYSQAPQSRLAERFLEEASLWYIPDHIMTVSYVDRWPRGTLNRQLKLSFFLGELSDQHWQYLFFFLGGITLCPGRESFLRWNTICVVTCTLEMVLKQDHISLSSVESVLLWPFKMAWDVSLFQFWVYQCYRPQ